MLLKNWCILVMAVAIAGCNNNGKPSGSSDTTLLSTADTLTKEPVVPGDNMQQADAQDTLFEDGSIPSSWSTAGFNDPAAFKRFLTEFKSWVKNNQADSIAAHIRFPVKAAPTAAAFKTHYDHIFNDRMKAVVLNQRLDRIFRNQNGAMLGSGEIWLESYKDGYRIISIASPE